MPTKLPVVRPLPESRPIPDRLTVVVNAFLERVNDEPHEVSVAAEAVLFNSCDMYQRVFEADAEWRPLDYGWIAGKVGLVIIDNRVGKNEQINPTPEERARQAKLVIQIITNEGATHPFLVRPGYPPALIYPEVADALRIRCPFGIAPFRLTVFAS